MTHKIALVLLIFCVSFLFGCSMSDDEIREIFDTNYIYSESTSTEDFESIATVFDLEEDIDLIASEDKFNQTVLKDARSAAIFKKTPGYTNICGIMTSGCGVRIYGNVKVYGGVYTREGDIVMGSGAIIVTDNDYIHRMASSNVEFSSAIASLYNNPDVFTELSNDNNDNNEPDRQRPVHMDNIPKRVKLINIREYDGNNNDNL